MVLNEIKFIDEYPSCSRCYATLVVRSGSLEDVSSVSQALSLKPDRTRKKGERVTNNVWMYTTQGVCESCDIRRHIISITELIKPNSVTELKKQGWEVYLACFWESESGNGGPILDPLIMGVLSELSLEIRFDIWLS